MTRAARKVLIVDDDPAVAAVLADFVGLEGYEVVTADDSADALRLASEFHFDAFLLDVDMPGTGGIALCRAIRGMTDHEGAVILFITATTTHPEEAFAAGCDDIVSKPFDRRTLRARLNGHLDRREQTILLGETRRLLDRYVSKRTREIVERSALTGERAEPSRRRVTVLFTDIRGFTSMSEHIDPAELFTLISAELATQVDAVYRCGGYVDKFGGDGLMAVFDGEQMAAQSCQCATEMIRGAPPSSHGDRRIRDLGIGIHLGPVVIGNIGSDTHLDYSVIGTTVNLAARLCGQAHARSVVVSNTVRDALPDDSPFRFGDERQVAIRGLTDLVTVYTLRTDGA